MNASWMSARRSWRTRSRLNWCSQLIVRSIGQRCLPRPLPWGVRRRAIHVGMFRHASVIRCASQSYPRSATTQPGLRSGAPTLPRIAGMARTSGINCVLS